jgi:hypothetical protein
MSCGPSYRKAGLAVLPCKVRLLCADLTTPSSIIGRVLLK